MTLLLDRLGNDVHITGDVVKAAAKNEESGKEILTPLLERRGYDMVKAAVEVCRWQLK